MNKIVKVSALVLFLGLASGCATTAAVNEAQATPDKAAADVAAAVSAAEAARAAADRAAQSAASAQSTADEALAVSIEAIACCEANRESMERMFKKSMSK